MANGEYRFYGTTDDIDGRQLALDASTEFRQILDSVARQIGNAELARRMGVHESHISRTRTGGRVPTRALVQAFARATVGTGAEGARARDRLMMAAGYMPVETHLEPEEL